MRAGTRLSQQIILQEIVHGLCCLGLAVRAVAFLRQATGLNCCRRGECHEQRNQRHGHREADAVPPHEFAGAISAVIRPRGDRLALEKPFQIVEQRTRAGVAVPRFPAQGFEDDRIEIARQARGERARGHAPRVRNLVDRSGLVRILEDDDVRRPWRFGVECCTVEPAARGPWRPPSREQLEQNQAEGVDVGGRRHRFTAPLLGCRVGWRQRAQPRARQLGGLRRVVIGEQLGDTEIEQLQIASRRYEDVRRLQIAMDDEPAMGVLHGLAHPAEQLHPCVNREAPPVAVRRDRLTVHEFHREVRPAVGVEAAVEEPCDGRVIELGENLPLAAEAHRGAVAVEAAPHELDRDDLSELAVGALGPIHDAHASTPQLVDHAIGTDASTHIERTLLGAAGRREGPAAQPCLGAIIQEVAGGGICGEQLLDSRAEGGIFAADAFEQGVALIDRKLERLIEQRFETRPARLGRWAVHAWPPRAI